MLRVRDPHDSLGKSMVCGISVKVCICDFVVFDFIFLICLKIVEI